MKVKRIIVGFLKENCYILEKEDSVLVIDPGDDYSTIQKAIHDKNVVGVLITHRHFDHIGALEPLVELYKCPVYEYKNMKEREYQIGPFTLTVIFTPGHSKDSTTYYFKEETMMFVGDFIFKGTIGRCDLKDGNYEVMMKSIEKIKEYPSVTIYPGHGESTTLDKEKLYNSYF